MLKIKLVTILAIFSAHTYGKALNRSEINVIYGTDDRKDIYQVTSPLHKQLAASTAGMIHISRFTKGAREQLFDFAAPRTLERAANICPGEKFSQQFTGPSCSGFLIGPDLLVTAGHCYLARGTAEENCKNFVWVFDFAMKSASHNPTKDIPLNNIYTCKDIVASAFTHTSDFAIVRLNRNVVGRPALKVRESGTVSAKSELVVIGHPTGLPTKVSANGKVTSNTKVESFSTTLDTFHGNSGSAVMDARTGIVEGILIQGKTDYFPSDKKDPKSCMITNLCDENAANCSAGMEKGPIEKGEVVQRIGRIQYQIKHALKNTP